MTNIENEIDLSESKKIKNVLFGDTKIKKLILPNTNNIIEKLEVYNSEISTIDITDINLKTTFIKIFSNKLTSITMPNGILYGENGKDFYSLVEYLEANYMDSTGTFIEFSLGMNNFYIDITNPEYEKFKNNPIKYNLLFPQIDKKNNLIGEKIYITDETQFNTYGGYYYIDKDIRLFLRNILYYFALDLNNIILTKQFYINSLLSNKSAIYNINNKTLNTIIKGYNSITNVAYYKPTYLYTNYYDIDNILKDNEIIVENPITNNTLVIKDSSIITIPGYLYTNIQSINNYRYDYVLSYSDYINLNGASEYNYILNIPEITGDITEKIESLVNNKIENQNLILYSYNSNFILEQKEINLSNFNIQNIIIDNSTIKENNLFNNVIIFNIDRNENIRSIIFSNLNNQLEEIYLSNNNLSIDYIQSILPTEFNKLRLLDISK